LRRLVEHIPVQRVLGPNGIRTLVPVLAGEVNGATAEEVQRPSIDTTFDETTRDAMPL
jgi:hypothetical protein